MTDDERRHINNLILLCDDCHGIIDNKENVHFYTVELLREWKQNHEELARMALHANPSYLANAIEAIAQLDFTTTADTDDTPPPVFEIDQKISYNQLIRNRQVIEQHRAYYSKLSALYSELELQGSFRKENLLRNIAMMYSKVRGKHTNSASQTEPNGDDLFEEVEESLMSLSTNSTGLHTEDISFGVTLIMVDAFMRCKILEEPPVS